MIYLNRYKLVIAYEGTDFCGWLSQPGLPSVSYTIRKTFTKVFKAPLHLAGASKTDAGVHAYGQVALLRTPLFIEPHKLLFAMNNRLPSTIVIRSAEFIHEAFHPRVDVIAKIYHYQFFLERPLPYYYRYGFYHYQFLDIEKLKKALQLFVGTHDFRAYYTGPSTRSMFTIDTIDLDYISESKSYKISVTGERFARHMIRRIVGAALYAAAHPTVPLTFLKDIMQTKNQNNLLPTACSSGLLLHSIIYKERNLQS